MSAPDPEQQQKWYLHWREGYYPPGNRGGVEGVKGVLQHMAETIVITRFGDDGNVVTVRHIPKEHLAFWESDYRER